MHNLDIKLICNILIYIVDSLSKAINLAMNNNGISVTTELYPLIRKKFRTTVSRIDREIGNSNDVTWSSDQGATVNKIFDYTIRNKEKKPTNSKFIVIL